MNRATLTDWRGQTDWNSELETGAPVQRFTPFVRPIDLLDEEAAVHRLTPAVQSIDVFDEDIEYYLPLNYEAVPVGEAGAHRSLAGAFDLPYGNRGGSALYDPALDEFFVGGRFGESRTHGPFGDASRELHPVDGAPDDVVVTSAADAEAVVDAYMARPHDEMFAVPLNEVMDAFGVACLEATFGGGDDPLWMLTLLPTPDDLIHDTGFGHPGLGLDPWG